MFISRSVVLLMYQVVKLAAKVTALGWLVWRARFFAQPVEVVGVFPPSVTADQVGADLVNWVNPLLTGLTHLGNGLTLFPGGPFVVVTLLLSWSVGADLARWRWGTSPTRLVELLAGSATLSVLWSAFNSTHLDGSMINLKLFKIVSSRSLSEKATLLETEYLARLTYLFQTHQIDPPGYQRLLLSHREDLAHLGRPARLINCSPDELVCLAHQEADRAIQPPCPPGWTTLVGEWCSSHKGEILLAGALLGGALLLWWGWSRWTTTPEEFPDLPPSPAPDPSFSPTPVSSPGSISSEYTECSDSSSLGSPVVSPPTLPPSSISDSAGLTNFLVHQKLDSLSEMNTKELGALSELFQSCGYLLEGLTHCNKTIDITRVEAAVISKGMQILVEQQTIIFKQLNTISEKLNALIRFFSPPRPPTK